MLARYVFIINLEYIVMFLVICYCKLMCSFLIHLEPVIRWLADQWLVAMMVILCISRQSLLDLLAS